MKAIAAAGAGVLLIGLAAPVLAEDLWDPPWDLTLPAQTSQAWESVAGPGPDPCCDENPYGTATFADLFGVSYWDGLTGGPLIPGHDGQEIPTWHVDQPGGGVVILVPNDPDPNKWKLVFWQVTSDKAPDPSGPTTQPPGANRPTGYPQVGHQGTWYTYNGLIEIPENPPEEFITFTFPESTNIEEIVIKTICIPEPATLGLLAAGGLLALVRRKRR